MRTVKICFVSLMAILLGVSSYVWNAHRKQLMDTALDKAVKSAYISFNDEPIEYGDRVKSVFSALDHATGIVTTDDTVDVHKPGTYTCTYELSVTEPVYGQRATKFYDHDIVVQDTVPPEIVLAEESISVEEGEDLDLYALISSVSDPIDGNLRQSDELVPGTYTVLSEGVNTNTPGTCKAKVQAKDINGNVTEKTISVEIREKIKVLPGVYVLKVNRAANTVTVYSVLTDGSTGDPVKAMVCSTGRVTPLGTYKTFGKSRWRALFGGVYGQYATDIVGDILFHSVPYFSQRVNDLEYDEYNKLGTKASMGCVRLSVADAKWIYDNCGVGTTVVFYDDADIPGPLGKPVPIHIDTSDSRRGWDPTDPDPDNPWR